MTQIKKIIVSITLLSLLFLAWLDAGYVQAAPLEYSGGVRNEHLYEEYVFITGVPVKFSGEVKVSESGKKDKITTTYRFNLTSSGPAGKLTRQVTMVTDLNERADKAQTTSETKVTKYTETIDINGNKFTLKDFQFSQSDVVDHRVASDFQSGTVVGKKIYTKNKGKDDQDEITVTLSGGNVAYHNFWGSTDTQLLDQHITTKHWEGTIRSQASDSMIKVLRYEDHQPAFSSFDGGHARVTQREMVSRYDYDLPAFKSSGAVESSSIRNRGSLHLSQEFVPQVERLIVPKFRDLTGHWAKDDIEKLYSLDIFEESTNFFVPDAPMNRYDFTKAVMRAADIRVEEPKSSRRNSNRNQQAEKPIFRDMDVKDKDYPLVKKAIEKGVAVGLTADTYGPKEPLTRAQAITMLVRAVGFEHRAPSPKYRTTFSDDWQIPYWAKDSIYMAEEIGLISGDDHNRVRPNEKMTRAEAAAMLIRYLGFLEQDLQRDYRENIIFYN